MLFPGAFAADAPKTTADTSADVHVEATPYALSAEKSLSDTLVFLVFLFAIFYFILIRPQQKRLKAHQAMLKSIQKGSRVVTGGGIIGTVSKLEDDDVVLVEIAQGVKVKIARSTISEVLLEGKASSETANDN